jgi:hypothetical protein
VTAGDGSAGRPTTIDWSVFTASKRPTRLPEAAFFASVPHLPPRATPTRANGWELTVLNHTMDPTDVVGSLGRDDNSTQFGGSPHLRAVEAARWRGEALAGAAAVPAAPTTLTLRSLDVPVVALGEVTPFPSPRTEAPDMVKGVHFNILQNLWNTKCVAGTGARTHHTARLGLSRLDVALLILVHVPSVRPAMCSGIRSRRPMRLCVLAFRWCSSTLLLPTHHPCNPHHHEE